MSNNRAHAKTRHWSKSESGVTVNGRDLCGWALHEDAERITAMWNACRGLSTEHLKTLNFANLIEAVFKTVERGLFTPDLYAEDERGALKWIASYPSSPFKSEHWNWDVDHKDYAEEFYAMFPKAKTCVAP